METKLHTLTPGESAIVQWVDDSSRGLAGRLRDLGFTQGSRITYVRPSPLGDPLAFRVRGALIALRREDAALVTVRICGMDPEGGNL